jgi:hypothetical protein
MPFDPIPHPHATIIHVLFCSSLLWNHKPPFKSLAYVIASKIGLRERERERIRESSLRSNQKTQRIQAISQPTFYSINN